MVQVAHPDIVGHRATALAMAWSELFGEDKAVSYNRKEAKDHGEVSCLYTAVVDKK